jgi:hypothetical protein
MFRVFFDMDGTLAEWKAAKEPEDLYEKDYFLSLKPYQSVVEAAWKLYESGETEVFILSAVLADSRYAIPEKNAWLGEYLPWVDIDHRLYVEGSVPKRLRVPGGVRMTDVLVDDYTKNLKEWPVFGDAKFGRAVKLLNGINGTNGTWTGISVSRFFTPKSIADVILKVGRRVIFDKLAKAWYILFEKVSMLGIEAKRRYTYGHTRT